MFRFSLSTVLMTFIASNLLLVVITSLLRNTKVLIRVGYNLIVIFVAFVLLRCVFPLEFIPAKDIYLRDALSQVAGVMRHQWTIGSSTIPFTLWNALEIVWLGGFLVVLFRHLNEKRMLIHHINRYGTNVTDQERYVSVLKTICRRHKRSPRFRVFEVEHLKTAMICGGFKPCILIPKGLKLSEEDLYYVLCHETSHYYHRDFIIAELVELVVAVYWWNKLARDLNKQTEAVLEMRVDDAITAAGKEELYHYLSCLCGVIESAEAMKEECISVKGGLSLLDDNEIFHIRMEMMLAGKDKQIPSLKVALAAFGLTVLVASYCVTLETMYVPAVDQKSVVDVSLSYLFYAIENENHTYDIYLGDGFYMETVDSLKRYPMGIAVYKDEKERVGDEKVHQED